jgi:two-component system, OmpR family, sensor histidine kinase BaeS
MSRGSLRTRLIILCVAVVGCAIALTAAIVSLSTTASIHEQYRQDIGSGAAVYNGLLGYAATHKSWAELTPKQLRQLGPEAGQITITDLNRRVVATTAPGSAPPTRDARPAATIDVLAPDPALSRTPLVGGIDGRVEGPFRLSRAERTRFDDLAAKILSCLGKLGKPDATTAHYPNGHAYITDRGNRLPPTLLTVSCSRFDPPLPVSGRTTAPDGANSDANGTVTVTTTPSLAEALGAPTRGERTAATQLNSLFRSCLHSARQPLPAGYPSIHRVDYLPVLTEMRLSAPAQTCLSTARRTQLAAYVAPPALLFISGSVATNLRPGLSRAAIERITAAAAAILLIAVLGVVLAANGVSRPLRVLTGAVGRMRDGEQPMRIPTTGTKEVAALTEAFNHMSADLASADARRKEMISDIAHELRSPLGNIRGWLEAVQDRLVEPDSKLVASLLDESRLLQSVIDDLQVLALADAHRLVIHSEPIDLGDVLEQVTEAQRLNAASKGLRLDLVRHGDLGCTADSDRLRQAIGNIVTNAIRYTDHGAVTITASGTDQGIDVDIADTGTGISADELPHIFDRFWRAEKSRDRRHGGSGLGLAITRHLVQAHNGRIEASSTPGEGTTFRVYLPRDPGL